MRTISDIEKALVSGGNEDPIASVISNGYEDNGWGGSGAALAMGGYSNASSGGMAADIKAAEKGVNSPADCKGDVHAGVGFGGALGGALGSAGAGLIASSWAGPGALIGAVVGAGVGLYVALSTSAGCQPANR